MFKRRKKRRKFKKDPMDYIALPKIDLDPDTKKGIFIVLILALGAISFLSLFGLAGNMGVYLAKGVTFVFGVGRWLFPVILLAIGFFLYNEDKYEIKGSNYFGLFIFIISFHGLIQLFIEHEQWQQAISDGYGGGYVGLLLASAFINIMGFWASLVVLVCLILISLMLMFNTNLSVLIGRDSVVLKIFYPLTFIFVKIFGKKNDEDDEYEEDYDEIEKIEDDNNEEENDDDEGDEEYNDQEENIGDKNVNKQEIQEAKFTSHKINHFLAGEPLWQPTNIKIDLPLNLLNSNIDKPTSGDIKANTLIIQRTLENFNIPVEMGEVSVGPTVTQYTLRPSEGIKLSRIIGLNNDLSLALGLHPIRIEAPIPNQQLVGIEVPNKTKAIVSLKEILLSKNFKNKKSNLNIAIGKDVSGKAWLDDLSRMPHLLVAGTTGAGKSVMLNSIILSLMFQNNPDDLRFIMVDPKRVELTVYDKIPYLLSPVITDVSKTINALKWCLNEMDRRFDTLRKHGKRDIVSYNKSSRYRMPYIVFIIDELADLMVAAARDVEAGIIRIAQMARAVGIHLVLATQRPSVDVITGLIKANMPGRIAFSVASSIDSRTILDAQGAEKLLGKGDMLFATAEMSKPKRLQGAYISDYEIKKVINYIKEKGGGPIYDENIVERQKVKGIAGVGMDGDNNDEMMEEAKELIINSEKASTTFLQRRLRIGYARAANIMDLLEEAGVVGPANGSKKREILISKEQYENLIDQGISGVNLHNQDEMEAPENYLGDDEDNEVESEKSKVESQKSKVKSHDDDEDDDEDGKYFSK